MKLFRQVDATKSNKYTKHSVYIKSLCDLIGYSLTVDVICFLDLLREEKLYDLCEWLS